MNAQIKIPNLQLKQIEFLVVENREDVLSLKDCLRLKLLKVLDKEVETRVVRSDNKLNPEQETNKKNEGKITNKKKINIKQINKYNIHKNIYSLANMYFSIKLIPNSTPFVARERTIPFSLRAQVEEEIKSLIKQNI